MDNVSSFIGKLKIIGEPANFCVGSNEEFLTKLVEYVVAEFPEASQNVVYSNEHPKDSDRNKVWFQKNNSGSFVGIRLFYKGEWIQIYPVSNDGQNGKAVASEIKWIKGDSRDVPTGWKLVDEGSTIFNNSELSQIQGQYIVDTTGTYYTYFAIEYVGF